MRKALYRILFIQILLLNYNAGFTQPHKPDSVKVEFEGFYTETFVDVTCDAFDITFLKTKKIKVIHDDLDLSNFES
jgi:hypothetical protein